MGDARTQVVLAARDVWREANSQSMAVLGTLTTPMINELKRLNDALQALDAAALSPSPPAPGGVPIRIAVAMTHEGDWVAGGRYGWTDEGAWQHCPSGNRWHRAAIITATVAPPVVAEIEGRVEAGGES